MSRTLALGALLLFLAASLHLGGTAAGQDGEAAFATGLKRISSDMSRGKWKRALDGLERLVAAHAEQDYVRLRGAEIVEMDRRCRFRAAAPAIDPDDLISGDLRKCDFKTGKVDIRYTRKTLKDFQKTADFIYHPLKFTGPYVIEVSGPRYPKYKRGANGRASPPLILVCNSADSGFSVNFGFEQTSTGDGFDRWRPATIYNFATKKTVAEKEITLARSGRKYRLKVKVDNRRITAYVNNKVLVKATKPSGLFGGWAFSNLGKFAEIRIKGKAETAWLQGLMDAAREKHRQSFAKTYHPKKVLPAWLFQTPKSGRPDRVARAGKTRKRSLKLLPGPTPSEGEARNVSRALGYLMTNEPEKCDRYLARLTEPSMLSDVLRAYLEGMSAFRQGDQGKAYERFKKVCKLDPEFEVGYQLLISTALAAGRAAEVLGEFKRLLQNEPKSAYLQASYLECLIRVGRFDEARAAHVAARRHGVEGKRITQLGRTITQALRGPDWGRVFEHKSAHYHVYSNIDRETCKRAAKLLEDAYRAYNVHLARARKGGKRFKVYLFAGRAGYQAYSEATLGDKAANEAGCYSPWLRQLLIWNSPEREFMMRVVRHEGSHQFVHAALGDAPVWFDEGLAEYHETAEYRNGKWAVGQLRPDHLEKLKPERKFLRLALFLRIDGRQFYGEHSRRNYAQAWAFMHFLRHGPRKYRPIYEGIVSGLAGGEASGVVVKRVLGPFDLVALDLEFRAYVKGLAEQS